MYTMYQSRVLKNTKEDALSQNIPQGAFSVYLLSRAYTKTAK